MYTKYSWYENLFRNVKWKAQNSKTTVESIISLKKCSKDTNQNFIYFFARFVYVFKRITELWRRRERKKEIFHASIDSQNGSNGQGWAKWKAATGNFILVSQAGGSGPDIGLSFAACPKQSAASETRREAVRTWTSGHTGCRRGWYYPLIIMLTHKSKYECKWCLCSENDFF